MKFIWIAVEIYVGGLAFLTLLYAISFLWRKGKKFDGIIVAFILLWPLVLLAPFFWYWDYVTETKAIQHLSKVQRN